MKKTSVKLYDFGTVALIIIGVAAIVGVASTKFMKMEDDNAIEEASEEMIRHQSGFDIDLSPGSPESKVKK